MVTAPVVVVGAGLSGAAAAWRLATAGRDVVVIEAEAPAHRGGSSHGSARIFRHAYPDPFYVGLTVQALAGWHELEDVSGERLLTTTGGLDAGDQRDLPAIRAAFTANGLPFELLDEDAARERFPHLALGGPVLHQPGAGVIDAERAVGAMLDAAVRAGAELVTGERVEAADAAGDGAVVRTDSGRAVRASTVVVAAGGWLPELAPRLPGVAGLLPPLTVTQQQAFHFPFPKDRGPEWPVFVLKGDRKLYSLPGGRDAGDAGFKIAEHDHGLPVSASTRDGLIDPASRDRVVAFVEQHLPGVDPVPYAETSCLYTSTPTEDFIVDRVGPIVVASPCSGHGAKFAPLLGELIADVAAGGPALPRFGLPRERLVSSAT